MNYRGRMMGGLGAALAMIVGLSTGDSRLNASPRLIALPGHTLPAGVLEGAKPARSDGKALSLAVRLLTRSPGELEDLITSLYTPGDPLYGRYLSVQEFAERFGATPRQLAQVSDYFQGIGCTLRAQHPNRLLLDVECSRQTIETALVVKISDWISPSGDPIRAIDRDPSVPVGLPIEAILGLTSTTRHPNYVKLNPDDTTHQPLAGSGPGGGLSPGDIKTAYGLGALSLNGAGQTLALFELDGYNASDVSAYLSNFAISPAVPLQNVLVDGSSGSAGSGAPEVTLDIELMMAIAPGASKIVVYEGPNTDAGVIDTYQKIANDDLARQISTSWGGPETQSTSAFLNSENRIFGQMAAEGQTLYAASGDSGALDDGTTVSVDDPASQPYVSAAGGTTLTTAADHSYTSETTWWNATKKQGGGGGISAIWPIPSWQSGAASSAAGASTTHRNLPDVALNADPATGYAIYVGGAWNTYGGTSCAAPLWAAFTALTNQKRQAGGFEPLGFANPSIYQVAQGANYAADFHDIADGSTNGHYTAVTGYDLATGWGSFEAGGLTADLAAIVTPVPSPAPSIVPTPTPTPLPNPPGGCAGTPKPQNLPESTNAALSLGIVPVIGGLVARRKRKR